jgi:D-glycero-D-manno-heptose 1,7-bisphosphate phosphatase
VKGLKKNCLARNKTMLGLNPEFEKTRPNRSWTLFIDRDGVINRKREKDYVKTWDQFIFIKNSLTGLRVLSEIFGRLLIVTNQRGIGRRLMTEETLLSIHARMLEQIRQHRGRIDKIYYCPHLEENDPQGCRKPRIGMALQAKADFPEIDFSRSIMIGDALSDMEFGRKAGMHTVWVSSRAIPPSHQNMIDWQVNSLFEFSQWLRRDN